MRSKTVIAMAVAGALSLPLGTLARDRAELNRAEVITPVSVNEAGDARMQQVQGDRFTREHHAFINDVQTPLSTPEAGAADGGRQLSQERMIAEGASPAMYPHESTVTPMSPNESSASQEEDWFRERASSNAQPPHEVLVLADPGVYSEYYLVGVPQAAYTDYYVVPIEPSRLGSNDAIVFVPRQ